jgi:hypothetical protein
MNSPRDAFSESQNKTHVAFSGFQNLINFPINMSFFVREKTISKKTKKVSPRIHREISKLIEFLSVFEHQKDSDEKRRPR